MAMCSIPWVRTQHELNISWLFSLICNSGIVHERRTFFVLRQTERTVVMMYGSMLYDAVWIPSPLSFLSAASGSQFPSGLLWAPMTNFYVFIKNERRRICVVSSLPLLVVWGRWQSGGGGQHRCDIGFWCTSFPCGLLSLLLHAIFRGLTEKHFRYIFMLVVLYRDVEGACIDFYSLCFMIRDVKTTKCFTCSFNIWACLNMFKRRLC